MMNQLKSIYNSPFKDLHSQPNHTCFLIIAGNLLFTYEAGAEFTIWITDTDLFFAHVTPVVKTVIHADHIDRSPL